ncbi:MAG: hypothetical protein CMB99_14080 [Flavobacteriaceae bacterium]|nr:hypothetical protein [Flavobacteriaceae bacterium]|tara:strand:- start:106318 stop:107022 length:705 start_codon:yes stop_codon:yes gene_type:complete
MKIVKLLTLISLALIGSKSFAQGTTTVENNMQWIQYYTTTDLNEHWAFQMDAGYRLQNSFENKVGYIVRSAISYGKNKQWSFAAGLGYLGGYQNDVLNRNEFRPHQEVNFKTRWKKLGISNRLRIEERFLLNKNTSNSFNVRFRYNLMFGLKLFGWSEQTHHLDLNFGNEIFLQAWNQNINTSFQQNRLMLSPTLVLDNLSFGLTFTKQFTTIGNGLYRDSDLVWLQIRHHFSK